MAKSSTSFKKGTTGNPKGRPVGSRQKLSEDFITAVAADFAKHGIKCVETLREKDLTNYMRIIASFVPKEVEVSGRDGEAVKVEWADDPKELARRMELLITTMGLGKALEDALDRGDRS